MQDKRSLALLDVDATLIIGNDKNGKPIYNEILINALKKQGVRDAYLFTRIIFRSIDSINNRESVKKWLVENGFTVHGVITPNDATWEDLPTGLIKWSDFRVEISENWPILYHQDKRVDIKTIPDILQRFYNVTVRKDLHNRRPGIAYDEAHHTLLSDQKSFDSIILKSWVASWSAGLLYHYRYDISAYSNNKGAMLELVLDNLKKPELFGWVDRIIGFDDEEDVCTCLEATVKQLNPSIPVDIIRAEAMDNNAAYYARRLKDIFHQGWREEERAKWLAAQKHPFFKSTESAKDDPRLTYFVLCLNFLMVGGCLGMFILYYAKKNSPTPSEPSDFCPALDNQYQENTCLNRFQF